MRLKKVYRRIAKEFGVSISEVQRKIEIALQSAYSDVPDDGVTRSYQNKVPKKGETPTAEEFIKYAANQLILNTD